MKVYITFLPFRYRAMDRHVMDFVQDSCCFANTTALELCAHLENKNVIFVSYENKVCEKYDQVSVYGTVWDERWL